MSAQPVEKSPGAARPRRGAQDGLRGPTPEHGGAPEQVEVRRNAAVSLCSAWPRRRRDRLPLAGGRDGPALDWLLCVVLGAARVLFRSLLDARSPLLVADELGVRVRLGSQWRGLPWEAIDRVVVKPRRGLLRDGRVVVKLHHVHRRSRASRAAHVGTRCSTRRCTAPRWPCRSA